MTIVGGKSILPPMFLIEPEKENRNEKIAISRETGQTD
jgi:hypothetical protein